MNNFDLKNYLTENKITSNSKILAEAEFDIHQELKLGDVLVDGEKDRYKVVAIGPNSVELKPLTYKGQNSTFQEDFGNDVDLEDIWGYLNPEKSLKEAETSTEWRDVANILQKALSDVNSHDQYSYANPEDVQQILDNLVQDLSDISSTI